MAETIFTAVVGLVGTWMGTILAFYYTKDNFDTAAKNTQKLVDKISSTEERLNNTKAAEVMLARYKFDPFVFNPAETLKNLIDKFFSKNNRLPIFDKDDKPLYVLHGSIVDRYIARDAQPDTNTLKEMLDFKNAKGVQVYKQWAESFITVKESDSLAVVKRLMEDKTVSSDVICSDAFVTLDGSKNTKVIGWITNANIAKHSEV